MKIVIVDAGGLIGPKVVSAIRRRRHEAIPASPAAGIGIAARAELTEMFTGALVVIDVCEPPLRPDASALERIQICCDNVIAAAAAARIRHFVALSEVGADRLADSSYFRAHRARESLIAASSVPHTILRSTQFFEDVDRSDRYVVKGAEIRVAPVCVQPVLSDEVAAALTDIAVSHPRNSTLEMAGPERLRLDELVRQSFGARRRSSAVVTDERACYLGAQVADEDLMPDEEAALIGVTRFEHWLAPPIRRAASPP